MGFIHLLHNGYRGKLGETVGQKWKNQLTLRTYQETNNSKSAAQLTQRAHYKQLIALASQIYPSSSNVILPKKSGMNKFNYVTSLVEEITKWDATSPLSLKSGVYSKTNIVLPYLGSFNNKVYAYIYLPQGGAPSSMKDYPVSIIGDFLASTHPPVTAETFFTGNIIPRSLKPGVLQPPTPRGFFAELNLNPAVQSLYVFSVGKKVSGGVQWSTLHASLKPFRLDDFMTEPLR